MFWFYWKHLWVLICLQTFFLSHLHFCPNFSYPSVGCFQSPVLTWSTLGEFQWWMFLLSTPRELPWCEGCVSICPCSQNLKHRSKTVHSKDALGKVQLTFDILRALAPGSRKDTSPQMLKSMYKLAWQRLRDRVQYRTAPPNHLPYLVQASKLA